MLRRKTITSLFIFALTVAALAHPTVGLEISSAETTPFRVIPQTFALALRSMQDCNSNGVDDTLDIAAGTSIDCNTNGDPDECETFGPKEIVKLLPGPDVMWNFGYDIAVDNNTLVIGAPEPSTGANIGSVFVYQNSNGVWEHPRQLRSAETLHGDYFGRSVAISGDYLAVGAPYADAVGEASGAIYVFHKVGDEWQEELRLVGSETSISDNLGETIAIHGDTIAASGDDNKDEVYVFRRVNDVWQEIAKLTHDGEPERAYYADALAIFENTILVGARTRNEINVDEGAVYVFEEIEGTWQRTAKITSPHPIGDFYGFGTRVALDGDWAAISGTHADEAGSRAGNIYLFHRDKGNWNFITDLATGMIGRDSLMGYEMVFQDGLVLSRALLDSQSFNNNHYSVLAFQEVGGEWRQTATLTKGSYSDSLGRSLAIQSDTCFIAAGSDAFGNEDGLVYVHQDCRAIGDCNGNGTPDDCEIAGGSAFDCDANGIIDVCQIPRVPVEDCNYNGIPDACELIGNDCNSDGIPDECEIDCNTNGRPDACEIAEGLIGDCDGNLVYDGCPDLAQIAQTITSPLGDYHGFFGASVDIDGDFAIIGSSDVQGCCSGSTFAAIYRLVEGEWVQDTILTSPTDDPEDSFGASVAIEGNIAVVTAPDEPSAACLDPNECGWGAIYVYKRIAGTWRIVKRLVWEDHLEGTLFGEAAILHEGYLLTTGRVAVGSSDPRVLLFDLNAGSWSNIPLDETILANGFSGDSDTIFTGYASTSGGRPGEVRVLEEMGGTWVQQETNPSTPLMSVPGTVSIGFGLSIGVAGDVAIISSYREEKVFVARRINGVWNLEESIALEADPDIFFFGSSVSIFGNMLLVSTKDYTVEGSTGSIYFFENNGANWNVRQILHVPTEAHFPPNEIAISNNWAVFSATHKTVGDNYKVGEVHFIRLNTDCNQNQIPDSCEIDQGLLEDCNRNGVADECELLMGSRRDCNANGILDDCELLVPGDYDGDWDVDEADVSALVDCLGGPCLTEPCTRPTYTNNCCSLVDMDHDHDVDLFDYDLLQRAFSGSTGLDCNGNGLPDLTETRSADLDGDSDVDLEDFAIWRDCTTAPCGDTPCQPPHYTEPCCILADFDEDGDVDLADVTTVMTSMSPVD